jgi:signal transduction histidine kinase
MGSQETRIFTAVLTTCFLLGSVFLYFLWTLLKQRRHNIHLKKANNIAEISAMEKERSRIAADLHDEIIVYITSVKTKTSYLQPGDSFETGREAIIKEMDEVKKRIKEISFDLMPSTLLRQGLISGISGFIDSLHHHDDIAILFYHPGQLELPEQKAINIFRVVQEVLHNVIKHSGATQVIITMETKEPLLILKIGDNGIGLDYDAVIKETSGLGLRSILNRIDIMGGHAFVRSEKGKGLGYVFEIPLK